MKKIVFIILLFIVSVSCGTQRQLRKAFVDKPVSAAEKTFGEPTTIIETEGEKIYIFEKTEKLESTEIGQGHLTLDPIITPKVTKTERFLFTVKNGTIVKTRFEEEYER